MIIVNTRDALLVAPLNEAEKVKQLMTKLKGDKREEVKHHKKVYRPWGSYDVIHENSNFKVKRIDVKPHCSLSLQKHQHRSETKDVSVILFGASNIPSLHVHHFLDHCTLTLR